MSTCQITLITTGGTIGETSQSQDPQRQFLSATDLLRSVGAVQREVSISTLDLLDIPSPFITFDQMLQVSQAVDAAIRDGADGVVVTHGTATLEETAFFVDVVSSKAKPIVFTGAMLPPDLPGADGPANLRDALLVASSPEAREMGVLVTLAGEIHTAREVTKAHTTSTAAFRSAQFGPIGTVEEETVHFSRYVKPCRTIHIDRVVARVEGLKCYADMIDVPLRALIVAGVDGIVLEIFGSGQVPPSLMPAIRAACEAKLTLVASTRCPAGRLLRHHYGMPLRAQGDERDLLDAGVIFSRLQGLKARILLAVALSADIDPTTLDSLFA